jgi:hypothetical protein
MVNIAGLTSPIVCSVKVKVVVPVKVPFGSNVNVAACAGVILVRPLLLLRLRLMFHWLVKWKRYTIVPSVSVADNALIAPAVDGILAVVTSFAVGGCYQLEW